MLPLGTRNADYVIEEPVEHCNWCGSGDIVFQCSGCDEKLCGDCGPGFCRDCEAVMDVDPYKEQYEEAGW